MLLSKFAVSVYFRAFLVHFRKFPCISGCSGQKLALRAFPGAADRAPAEGTDPEAEASGTRRAAVFRSWDQNLPPGCGCLGTDDYFDDLAWVRYENRMIPESLG